MQNKTMDIFEKLTGIRVECPKCGTRQDWLTWIPYTRLNWDFQLIPWECSHCRTRISFTRKGLFLLFPCLLFSIFMIRLLISGLINFFPNMDQIAGRGTLLSLVLVLSIFPLTLFVSGIFKKIIYRVIRADK